MPFEALQCRIQGRDCLLRMWWILRFQNVMQQRKCDFEFRMYRHSASKSIKRKFHSSVNQEKEPMEKVLSQKISGSKPNRPQYWKSLTAIPYGNICEIIFSYFIVQLEMENKNNSNINIDNTYHNGIISNINAILKLRCIYLMVWKFN